MRILLYCVCLYHRQYVGSGNYSDLLESNESWLLELGDPHTVYLTTKLQSLDVTNAFSPRRWRGGSPVLTGPLVRSWEYTMAEDLYPTHLTETSTLSFYNVSMSVWVVSIRSSTKACPLCSKM
jgi:hypothetical protein